MEAPLFSCPIIRKGENGKFSFIMPQADVDVYADFKKTEIINPFSDIDKESYYYLPVLWAVGVGITKGVSADSFAPDRACTCGQMATFLYRYFN